MDAHVAFNARKAIDDVFNGTLDRLDRILGAPFAVFDFRELVIDGAARHNSTRRGIHAHPAGAQLLDVNQEISQSAFHAFEQSQTRVGRIEPLHQQGDAIFEMRQRGVIGLREL